MDRITASILTALATGVLHDNTGRPYVTVILDAYDSLKAILKQKYGVNSDLFKAIEHVEKRPDSAGRRGVLQEEMAAIKAEQDSEILAAAQTLLDTIETQFSGDQNIPPFSSPLASETDQVESVSIGVYQSVPSPNIPMQRPFRARYFTGREAELDQLLASLQPGRVVTLSGPGGIGKSALASEAVWTMAPGYALPDRFPDGIIYHNFYDQPQAALALEHIARVFDEALHPTVRDAARRALSGRQALLVLDGAERTDDLTEVLTVRGQCGVLVTSRQRKDAADERQDLAPLPLEKAVDLLHVWAGSQRPNEAAALRICELLGRLPLALGLAGRYLAHQPETLADYHAWLEKTPLATLELEQRQQEYVPLLVERSLSQTSELARQILAVVGLLASATFDYKVIIVALAVGSQRGLLATVLRILKHEFEEQIPEVSRALDELVNYGLLRQVGKRYQVSHNLIHTYAQRHLAAPAETRERLVAHYSTLVGEQILLGLDGYAKLDAERPHLMALLAGCFERKEWEAAHSLAAAIEDYLDLQGHGTERVIANETGLVAARELGRRHNEGAWLGNLGLAYKDYGLVERAIDYYQQALAIAREISDRRGVGNSLGKLGLAFRDLGQTEQAKSYLEQSLAIFQEIQSPSAELVQDWLAELENE